MGDHDREAAIAQLVGGLGVGGIDPVQRRLQQQPLAARRAVGNRFELALQEPRDHLLGELAAASDVDPDPPGQQLRRDLAYPLGQRDRVGDELRVHVWRGHDRLGSLGRGGSRELDALVH